MLDQKRILDPDDVLKEIMNARKQYLSRLTAPISQGTGRDKRWHTRVPDPSKAEGRKLITGNTKEEVVNKVIAHFMQVDGLTVRNNITVSDCWQRWYDFKQKNNQKIKSTTFQIYESEKRKFLDGTEFSRRSIRDIDETAIEDYLLYTIRRYNLTRKRAQGIIAAVKGLMWIAYREKIIDSNPWDRVSLREVIYPACAVPKTQKDEDRVLTPQQIQAVITATDTHLRDNPLYLPDYCILIAIYTGMRAGEIVALQWKDIHDGYIYVVQAESRNVSVKGSQKFEVGDTKNHRERRIPVCSKLQTVLDRLKETDMKYVIRSPYLMFNGTKRFTANQLNKAAALRGKEAGINGSFTIHRVRRTLASCLNTQYDRATVSHILGHTEAVDAGHYDYDTVEASIVRDSLNSLFAS